MRHAATWGLQPRTSSVTLNLRLTSSGLASGQLVLRDPFPFVARWPDAGFLTTTDHLANTTNDQGLETHRAIHSAFNIGYMFFRPSALPLVSEWRKVIREQPKTRWDQGEFNRLARFQWKPNDVKGLSDPRLFWSYKKQVVGGVLPLSLFCGGHNYFVAQMPQRRCVTRQGGSNSG